jgi:beta propeller repeat protein
MDKRIFVVIALLVLLSSCGMASALKETRITTNTADQWNPSIWSNYIVWQDARNGGSDIYLQNMANKVQTRVTKGFDAECPCVSGNRIVWQDKRNGNWDIYMYEISTKKSTRITTNTKDQTTPSAYGNYIVWTDTRNGGSDIYLQNLATKVQTKVATNGYSPSIYGNKIVWCTEDDQGVNKIMVYNIPTKKTTVMIGSGMSLLSVSIYGNQVLWNDMFTGMFTGLYDFSAKKNIELPFTYVENPSLYSNKIVFQDSRNGNYDIYMAQI